MKRRFRALFFIFFCIAGVSRPAAGQQIPIDHFDGLAFDDAVPAQVVAGQAVPLSADIVDPGWQELVFSFRPLGGGDDIDVFVQHVADGVQRSFVFSPAQVDTYQVILFAGAAGGSLDFVGLYEPFVVQPPTGPILLPELFFDGLQLDEPAATSLPAGVATRLSGSLLDERIVSARLDISRDGIEVATIRLPLHEGRFNVPVRLPALSPGPVRVDLVVELDDGNYWGRGSFAFQITDEAIPVAAPAQLSVALRPGEQGDIVIENRGDAPLHVLNVDIDEPFEIQFTPAEIAPGQSGTIGIRYNGSGSDEADAVIHTDDPVNPRRRVALRGVADADAGSRLAWHHADDQGQLAAEAPVGTERFVLALLSGRHVVDPTVSYPVTIGPPPPAARPAAALLTARQRGEAVRAGKAARLAAQVRRQGLPARRAAQVDYQVGDERLFVFDEFPPVQRQSLQARVVAVSERAVAFVHVGTDAEALSADDLSDHLSAFDQDYSRIVELFGAPSDVDGDGRIAFLYTPLVDVIGLGGFQDPASVLDESVGGSGNLTDLLFLSPTQPAESYRSLLVHEFQHLINFHEHVLRRAGQSEATWLDEGLSHVAEDLVDGFVSGGNSDNVRQYLADPSAVGLTAQESVTTAERGAAYLFVRSLVDRFGEPVLSRLVQTGLADRDVVEQATGTPFRELLAGFAVRLYASGTGLAGHPRFDFTFAGLGSSEARGFPLPTTWVTDGMTPVAGSIRPRGVAFVEVDGPAVTLQSAPDGHVSAVLLPIPADFSPHIDIPADHFDGVRFDPPLTGILQQGLPARLAGQAVGASSVTAQYSMGDNVVAFFEASADAQGRFARSILLPPAVSGDLELHVFVDSEFAGAFGPVRIQPGPDAGLLPVDFFDTLLLDEPLPVLIPGNTSVSFAGQVLDGTVSDLVVELIQPDGQVDRVDIRVQDGRFDAELPFADASDRPVLLKVYSGDDSGLPFRGQYPITISDAPVTAVTVDELGSLPEQLALATPYPNPFNGGTIVALRTPIQTSVEVTVYALSGQPVAVLHSGGLPAGVHHLRWNGRDRAGRRAASGVYWVRATAVGWQATVQAVLLR